LLYTIDAFADDPVEQLNDAISKGETEKALTVIQAGLDVNKSDKLGRVPIFEACWTNNLVVVKALINAKADVNIKKPDGSTPIMIVPFPKESVDLIKVLIQAGADVNAKSEHGWTPIMGAAQDGAVEVIQLLIAAGADVNAKNARGETALSLAKKFEYSEVVDLLQKAGAKE
jgi:ankyrin repeat protein